MNIIRNCRLILDPSDFEKIPEKESYFTSYWLGKDGKTVVKQEVCEFPEWIKYYEVIGEQEILLGTSSSIMGLGGDEEVVIEWKIDQT